MEMISNLKLTSDSIDDDGGDKLLLFYSNIPRQCIN